MPFSSGASRQRGVCALAVVVVLSGCGLRGTVDVFTEEEFELIEELGPLPSIPPMPTNKYADDDRAAALGQRVFFEKGYSQKLTVAGSGLGAVGDAGKISCASCHDPKVYFTDTRSRPNATSVGVAWSPRNSPSLVNAAYYTWGGWAGRDDSLWMQAMLVHEAAPLLGSTRLELAHVVYRKYRADYDALFPVPLDPALDPAHPEAARFPPIGRPKASSTAPDGPWELMAPADREIVNQVVVNVAKALEAYQRRLVSRNAPIDRYVAGEHDALSPAAKRGLKLFIGKAACVDCHRGPTFTDQRFHNTGVPQVGTNVPRVDNGRIDDQARTLANPFNGAGKYSDDPAAGMAKLATLPEITEDLRGAFRTKSLRHVDKTGPYMHTGELATLDDVVRFYNWGGGVSGFAGTKSAAMVPLLLTTDEEADLVAFLQALTGEPVDDALTIDTAIP